MSIFDFIINPIARKVAELMESADEKNRRTGLERLGEYYAGIQPKQLKTKSGQYDDNLNLNQLGLIVERSVSMLFGPGVKFKLPEGAEAQQKYIDLVMKVNKSRDMLLELGLNGSVYGTGYVKIIPNGIVDPTSGAVLPRLDTLDSDMLTIVTNPRDRKKVEQYVMTWNEGDMNWREVTRHPEEADESGEVTENGEVWVIEYYYQGKNGKWELDHTDPWEYPFPPIIHCKNLPRMKSPYGSSDIEQVLEPQNKLNFVNSNIGKIIRYHAHPKTVGIGLTSKNIEKVNSGVDEMFTVSSPEARISNLEMQSDLASSRSFAQDIQREIDNIGRTVDTSMLADKVGALTNFGLRVLYSDALAKNNTKRLLYGELLTELVRRLLLLAGQEGANADPGELEWGEALPANETEKAALILADYQAGIISKETAQRKRGYNPDDEAPLIQAEQAAKQSAGSLLLADFFAGRQ